MQTAKKLNQSKLRSKAPADGSRRYKKGLFTAYDDEYERLAKVSSILTRTNDIKNAFSASGIEECKSSLLQLEGNEDNKYKEGKAWYTALIPAAKENLKEVYKDFKRWQQQQVSDGLSLKAPETWPSEMLTERLKAEARLDVRRREKYLLENQIEELKERQGKAETKEPILPDGPVCDFSKRYIGKDRRTELLDSVDGQNINYHSSGVPYINDEDSPYHLMPVATYRQMSKNWMKENRIRNMDIVERRNEYRKKMKEKGKADELPVNFTHRKFEGMIKGETVFKGQSEWPDFEEWPENPEWPEDAQTIEELENKE